MASESDPEMDQILGKKQPRVALIGSGIAGLQCASDLASAGFTNFVILEATDRIGGRIHSIDLETANDVKAELGANWIHGIDKNPIFLIAKQHNLLDEPVKGRSLGESLKFLKEDGSPVNIKTVEEVDWTYGMLMSQVEEFYQSSIPTPVENDSVGAFIERGFEMKVQQKRYPLPERHLRKMILDQRMVGEAIINGCHDLHEMALSEAGSFEELPGVHYVIRPGFEEIVRILKRNVPSENILLNHVVTQVRWNLSDNRNGPEESKAYEACVECQNGQKFYADYVLVTCSLGYLKQWAGRLFNPPLPDFKLDAINRLSIGTVNKIILEFEARVLPEGLSRLELIWDRSHVDELSLDEAWIRKIGSFDAIAETVVVGWLSGREAEYIETLTEEEVGNKCVETMKQILKVSELPKLKRVVMTRWKSHPYAVGSYTFIPIGASAEDIETMGEPVTAASGDKPVLCFAGEATHPQFYSSSHGALLSGQREAQRILDLVQPRQ